ncbi:5-amino-6-(5-phospho-D-ribitylamino)uracil phosphatase YcsE [Alicyclobacillus contaminans]|uniref:Cof-type HAD-IIB family hydrolase n=1 Tax=Alicyclobacillus contaminans TaxID=392016 RepID=UPI0004068CCB|nr:Cof-type HAD-IIB family hydrolase [Alicyclobacillus contaminans]GMA51230.1 5-amino-6-(5-phospho-D-ribitylamino)uracil phosphatase YcsE [Alicyclobacillus contaminans]
MESGESKLAQHRVRLLALDMDGTTLQNHEEISDETRWWLFRARECGIEFTFATGRHIRGLPSTYAAALGVRVPIVTMNGGEVWTPDGQLIERHTLPTEDVAWLHELARTYGERIGFWSAYTGGLADWDEFAKTYAERAWLKVGFFAEDEAVVAELWQVLGAHGGFELTNSHPLNIEVNPKGVTKASGLQTVVDFLGWSAEEVAAIGDSYNDIPMLRWAGLGIAMGNAQEAVKAEADWVTARCDEEGVARAIERLLHQP